MRTITTVEFLFPFCTAHRETEQESCEFVRNSIKFHRFVVLTLPRRVRKTNYSTEIRMLKVGVLSSSLENNK